MAIAYPALVDVPRPDRFNNSRQLAKMTVGTLGNGKPLAVFSGSICLAFYDFVTNHIKTKIDGWSNGRPNGFGAISSKSELTIDPLSLKRNNKGVNWMTG
jgi:hypothetical protein